jgi:glycosyltransferase involved in cell wall biosynthesis
MTMSHLRRGRGRPAKRLVVALVVDTIHPYSKGGREIRYHEYARRLPERVELHVFTMRWWDGPRVRVDGAVTFHAICPLLPVYSRGRRSIAQAVTFAIACLRLLAFRFDVIEADHMPYLQLPLLRAIASLKRKRLIVTWHEVWGPSYWRDYLGRLGTLSWLVEWLAMRLPDHIVAASDHTKERLERFLGPGAAVTAAPNGIDLEAIAATEPDRDARDVIVVGRLMAHKRLDMVLDAFALLHAQGSRLRCCIVGDGPDRSALHAHAAALGISEFVEFRHDVREQKDVYSLLKSAKVFVSASEREGFGIAVLEAIACGVPVITTSEPDNVAQELVKRSDRGVICDPSAVALASEIRELAFGVASGPAGSRAPEPWLADYTWESMTAKVLEVLGMPSS